MTSDPADDQMMLDLEPDDFHEPVKEDNVYSILAIIGIGHKDKDYAACVKFLEPVLEYEYQIIKKVLDIEQIKRDWCGE